jgi:aspartyl-tRNA(Asn)/glutamyl-tRNA(Gln) amidotransferase subunit B
MLYEKYEPVIGLEIHCQLGTESKLFSPDSASGHDAPPNTRVDPVSLGHPGTLPVLNRRALEHALKLGLASHCRIADRAEFARKHYFYPDLPKGYQITQHRAPLCYDGYLDVTLPAGDSRDDGAPRTRRVGLARVQLEEDAGKMTHAGGETRVDYNRCGVPLAEIVTEPDLRAPEEAAHLLRKVRRLARYLDVSNANMAEGALRCDANVSVRPRGERELGAKTELKNLNSFRHVERALAHEIDRQVRQSEREEALRDETRCWDDDEQQTRVLRTKETDSDYRYFPDPDLPAVAITDDTLKRLRGELPEMPAERRLRYMKDMDLSGYDAGLLTEDRALADFFEASVSALASRQGGGNWRAQAKATSNVVTNAMLRAMNERNLDAEALPLAPKRLAALVDLRMNDEISSSAAQTVFEAMLDSNKPPKQVVDERNLTQVSDRDKIKPVVEAVVNHHSDKANAYRNGKTGLLGFFIGRVKRRFNGSPNPEVVRDLLREKLGS